jgi:type I restriction enzyme R subunit
MAHFEQRFRTQPGKAMVVAMSRDICARLYDAIVALRPDWHDDDPQKGAIKVVMTAMASDAQHLQPHHTTKQQKQDQEKRFKDPAYPLKIVIVRDMWLTGFDAPCLATLYVDKPMQGANLAQAIARVNRVFKDKPGGLVVDYIGIAPQLKEALATYTASKGKGAPTIDTSEALRILKEKIRLPVTCSIQSIGAGSRIQTRHCYCYPTAWVTSLGCQMAKNDIATRCSQ